MPRIDRFSPWRPAWSMLLLCAFVMLFPEPVLAKPFTFGGVVVKIHDGDTMSVVRRGRAEKVHLAGIDCPELGQSFSQRAKNLTTRLASGQMVTVRVLGSDEKGRRIALVLLPDGRSLNRELVAAGLAWRATDSKSKELAKLEKEARRARRGLWAEANPTPPWKYRQIRNARR